MLNTEDFYKLISNDDDLIDQLVEWRIIKSPESTKCYACSGACTLRMRKRKTQATYNLRCKECKNEFSLFKGTFFAFEDENNRTVMRLPIQKVLRIIFYYFEGKTYKEISTLAEVKSVKTITLWCNFVREHIHCHLEKEIIGGDGKIIEIDESLMRGKRKSNKGRYLLGDVLDMNPANNSRKNNYGTREDGPWVFGMVEKGTRKLKLFYVEDRKASTLVPILRQNVHPGSTLWSDEWRGYRGINEFFASHQTVKHAENFVDPETGVNTQLIECIWSHAKLHILRNRKGTNLTLLQSHLSFFCFLYRYKHSSAFEEFMKIL